MWVGQPCKWWHLCITAARQTHHLTPFSPPMSTHTLSRHLPRPALFMCSQKAASGEIAHAEAAGRVWVAELDWSQPSHFTGGGEGGAGVITPPYDYILAGAATGCSRPSAAPDTASA